MLALLSVKSAVLENLAVASPSFGAILDFVRHFFIANDEAGMLLGVLLDTFGIGNIVYTPHIKKSTDMIGKMRLVWLRARDFYMRCCFHDYFFKVSTYWIPPFWQPLLYHRHHIALSFRHPNS